MRYLITFANERKYTLEFAEKIGLMNDFSLEEGAAYIDSLNIHSNGEKLSPRDYQIVGFSKAIRYKRMLIVSPTASGKSYMMYCISRYLLEHGECKKGLIIVPTTGLVKQMNSDFEDYGWNVEEHVHMIYGANPVKTTSKAVTMTTWQALSSIENWIFFADFDFVIGDEGHHFKAKSLKDIMIKLMNARYRIATTGTLDDWAVHRLLIEGLFGPLSKLTTTRKMIDEKQSSDLTIKALVLRHPPHVCAAAKKWKKSAYQREMDFLIGDSTRNKFITNLTLSLKGNTLLLFQYVDKHGKLLNELITNKVFKSHNERNVFFVHGKTETVDRDNIRSIVEKDDNAIIIASYGVFSEGVNIRNLHNIIFASPSKSKIRVLQSIGRGLRKSEFKSILTLYDITDDLRIDDYINYTLKHFLHRTQLYKTEDFKVSNYNIELNKGQLP